MPLPVRIIVLFVYGILLFGCGYSKTLDFHWELLKEKA